MYLDWKSVFLLENDLATPGKCWFSRRILSKLTAEGVEKPYFAQDMRGISLTGQDLPEWKKATFGGNKASYGRKTNLSILEQRQSLPIFKLRDELIKVQLLVLFICRVFVLFVYLFNFFNYWLIDWFVYSSSRNTNSFIYLFIYSLLIKQEHNV